MIYWGAWTKRNWIPNLKEGKNSRFSKYFLFSGENNYGRGSLVQKKKSSNLSLLTRAKYWIKNLLSLVRKWSSAKNKAFHTKVGEGEFVFSPISYNQKWACGRHVCVCVSPEISWQGAVSRSVRTHFGFPKKDRRGGEGLNEFPPFFLSSPLPRRGVGIA